MNFINLTAKGGPREDPSLRSSIIPDSILRLLPRDETLLKLVLNHSFHETKTWARDFLTSASVEQIRGTFLQYQIDYVLHRFHYYGRMYGGRADDGKKGEEGEREGGRADQEWWRL